MANTKQLASLFILQALLSPTILTSAQNSNIFREYIGAQASGVKFTDVPINPNVQFHFILAFAIDYDKNTLSPTNGKFSSFWDTVNLSPSAVASIKSQHSNVKVALSLGGYEVYATNGTSTIVHFKATSVSSWVSNAVTTLTAIIKQYKLDGIDIDYENFYDGDTNTFVECMGQLVTTLKRNKVISFASIAPFDDPHYQALWTKYSSVFDYVNLQFYAYPNTTTVDQFLGYFDHWASVYGDSKLLASFISDESLGLTPDNGFFEACDILQTNDRLPGIFVWSADTSYVQNNGFEYEKQAQAQIADN